MFEEDGVQYCWWPTVYKSDRDREAALRLHTEIGPENATMCQINIRYKSGEKFLI